jgi:hypothetical protein
MNVTVELWYQCIIALLVHIISREGSPVKPKTTSFVQEDFKMAAQRKKKAASQKAKTEPAGYAKTHSTVSAKMRLEDREKLLAVLERLKLTLPQLLIAFANEYEVLLDETLEDYYGGGYADSMRKFAVSFKCSKCGRPLYVTGPIAKAAAGEFLTKQGWGHKKCPEK